jgi:hypothetical protein
MVMEAEKLLANVNRHHGTALALAGRYGSGEQGAFKIVDRAGARYVLKFADTKEFQPANAATVTARLRGLGYPAPAYLLVGNHEAIKYSVQHEMRGEPIGLRINQSVLPQLLHLNDLQRGQGDSKNGEPDRLIRSVMEGLEEFCIIETLRTCSAETAAMLDALQKIAAARGAECPKRNDIVHFDFHNGNILMHENRISGVIDWEGCESGDCAFDLATFLFYAYPFPDFREQLWRELLNRTTRGAAAVYLAHMIVRQLDFSMRVLERGAIDYFLPIVRTVFRDISAL